APDLTGQGTILLVEDEEAVRRFAERALTRHGYRVIMAESGAEGLEVANSHQGTIDLILSDVVMPEMDGPTMIKELRKSRPDARVVFMSGHAEDAF
ncbi:response regulator, partial [Acinetobacter baumannii]